MKKILTLFALLHVQLANAQNNLPINTDRPDQSDGTYILTKNNFQIENGITVANQTFINNFMLRYGITNSTEIRLLADAGKEEGINGLKPIGVSIKQRIIENKGIVPAITLVGYLRQENIASKNFKTNETSYNIFLAFQNDITDALSVGYNIGTAKGFKNISFTTSVGYSCTNKLTTYAEYFSNFIKQDKPSHNIDGGLLYLLKNNLQIDAAIGTSLTEKNSLFFTTGISYRF
jgi:hypothetical protein